MIEVFRTNVNDEGAAVLIVRKIEEVFPGYIANFDLQDCDKVLRIDSPGAELSSANVIVLIERLGYKADVMPDVIYEDLGENVV